jgi:penicillin-binding protein 2
VLKNPDSLEQSIKTIISWAEENPPIREIKTRMQRLGVKSGEVTSIAETCKYTYFNYAQWTEGDAFNIAIGQGEAAFTPLQMANYFATIGNGGYRNSLSLLKATESEGAVARPQGTQAAISDPQHLKDVVTGLRRAVTSGTMSRGMAGLSIPVAGKSGTAQRAGYINPPDEVAYIKENLHRINGNLDWASVEAEMNRLMAEYPNIYPNANIAVRRAVINLSGRNFSSERIDAYKDKYEDFAWIVALAPADDPEIAVACLIVQGGSSSNAEPVVRELIGKYFEFKAADEAAGSALDYKTFFSEDHREGVSYSGILGGSAP